MIKFKEAVKVLKESPLFNVSLSSKELFHSNFLGWLIDTYREESTEILRCFADNVPDEIMIEEVKREEKNIDLTIYFKTDGSLKRKIVVENKVKSIPYLEQLEKYCKGCTPNDHFVLLSLVKPEFVVSNSIKLGKAEWKYISYIKLADILESVQAKVSLKNNYHGHMLQDYINFIRSLGVIAETFNIDWDNDNYDFNGRTNEILRLLSSIRIQDVYIKFKYDLIAHRIYESLKENFPENEIKFSDKWNKEPKDSIVVNYGMTRGMGLFDVKYVVGESVNGKPIILGVQLQGHSLRLFVECEDKKAAEKLSESLYENKLWFDFDNIDNLWKEQFPKGDDEHFNSFSGTFYYRSVKIDSCKMAELVDIVNLYMKLITKKISPLINSEKTSE